MIQVNAGVTSDGVNECVYSMKRSTDRILITHVGSLVRPLAIRDLMWARERDSSYDEAAFQKVLRDEVANVVRQQADTGIDIVSDGDFGKAG